jgi:hypothetical protein
MTVRQHVPSFVSGLIGAVVGVSLLGGVAYAATGGTFLLGRSNSATATTTLSDSKGTPLSLSAKAGFAPLKVNSATKVVNLNVDKIDNLDSTAFLRTTGTAANSAKLAGKAETAFALSTGQFASIVSTTAAVPFDNSGDQVNDSMIVGVTCPAGTFLVSGGFVQSTAAPVIASLAVGGNSWVVVTDGLGGNPGATAVCYNPRGAVTGGTPTANSVTAGAAAKALHLAR